MKERFINLLHANFRPVLEYALNETKWAHVHRDEWVVLSPTIVEIYKLPFELRVPGHRDFAWLMVSYTEGMAGEYLANILGIIDHKVIARPIPSYHIDAIETVLIEKLL